MWISLYARIISYVAFYLYPHELCGSRSRRKNIHLDPDARDLKTRFTLSMLRKKTGNNCLKTCLRLTDSPSNGEGLRKNVLVLIVRIRIRIRIRKFKNTGTVRIQFGSGYTTQVLRQFNLCICWRGFTCWMYLFWSWKLTLYFSSLGTLLDLLMEMASVLAISAASHVSCIWTGGKTLVLT